VRNLVGEVIVPAIKEGTYVLCDRFVDSTIAYQSGGRGLDRKLVESVNRLACGNFGTRFDDFIRFRSCTRTSSRSGSGSGYRWIDLNNSRSGFHQKVRGVYKTLVAAEPKRFLVLDATQSPSDLDKAIWHEVNRRFF
jgi:dTMP kinase